MRGRTARVAVSGCKGSAGNTTPGRWSYWRGVGPTLARQLLLPTPTWPAQAKVFNEPDQESWPEVKAYSEDIIKVIRANDPTNVILVGCPHWDQDINLPAADPIKGYQNLMYTMHFYAATHGKWLHDRTDAALQSGLPVFVSESAGMEASGDGPLNFVAWQEYIDWLEARSLSWVVWSVSDKDETYSMLQKSASSTGPWQDADLKESGLKTRAYLRKYNTGQ